MVNPHNGPGGSPLPDANYTREIPLLNSYSNVQALGYVATGYAKRDVQAIKNDIHTYSDWSTNVDVQNLKVEGIFFDETPGKYDAASANLLHEIQSEARLAHGFGSRCMVCIRLSVPLSISLSVSLHLFASFPRTTVQKSLMSALVIHHPTSSHTSLPQELSAYCFHLSR